MQVTFWGVRGSIPAPGPGTMRYGGNTPCISVTLAGGDLVIFDCGTGARNLGNALMSGPFARGQGTATVALSHAQWDHIQGFPFFRPFYVSGNRFRVVGGRSPSELQSVIEGQMAAQYFPVQTYRNMASVIELGGPPGASGVPIGAGRLLGAPIPGGPPGATGYRLEDGEKVLAYVGHGSPEGLDAGLRALCQNADLLIHEASFTPEDRRRYPERGLSSFEEAVALALASSTRRLALYHYDQDYIDREVDALVARARAHSAEQGAALEVLGAAEGLTITV